MAHTEQPEECDSCHWVTNTLKEYDAYGRVQGHGPFTPDDEKTWCWLCEICAGTYAGSAYQFPQGYENHEVLASIAWVTNRIIAELRSSPDPASLP